MNLCSVEKKRDNNSKHIQYLQLEVSHPTVRMVHLARLQHICASAVVTIKYQWGVLGLHIHYCIGKPTTADVMPCHAALVVQHRLHH